jgi:hypothetical protein
VTREYWGQVQGKWLRCHSPLGCVREFFIKKKLPRWWYSQGAQTDRVNLTLTHDQRLLALSREHRTGFACYLQLHEANPSIEQQQYDSAVFHLFHFFIICMKNITPFLLILTGLLSRQHYCIHLNQQLATTYGFRGLSLMTFKIYGTKYLPPFEYFGNFMQIRQYLGPKILKVLKSSTKNIQGNFSPWSSCTLGVSHCMSALPHVRSNFYGLGGGFLP